MIAANQPDQGPGRCLIPRSEYRIDDNWFVSGLKATGNNDLACAYALARQDLSFLIDRGRREEVSGDHGLFETVAIRRFHRDVNAGSHQGALTWHTNAEEYARKRLAQV